MELCKIAFRQARRTGPPFIWDRLQRDSKTWTLLLESLWHYQWSEPVNLSQELSDRMFFHTQGIHALVVLLFKLAQKEAIRNNTGISIKIIDKVAKERFVLLEPMLDSMRKFTQSPLEYEQQCLKKEAKLYEDLLYKVTAQPEVISERPKVCSKSPELDLTFKALKQMGYEQSVFEPFVLALFAQDPSLTANIAVKEFMSGIEEAAPQIIPPDVHYKRSPKQRWPRERLL